LFIYLFCILGIFPYEYCNSRPKLDDTTLPSKDTFFSSLTETEIDDNEYNHAIKVWDHFKCETLGQYSDLYLKVDVVLLADIFENFRNICLSTYNLDPAFYYTVPGLSFDAMLKLTSKKLQLLSDYDMILMIEKGIIYYL